MSVGLAASSQDATPDVVPAQEPGIDSGAQDQERGSNDSSASPQRNGRGETASSSDAAAMAAELIDAAMGGDDDALLQLDPFDREYVLQDEVRRFIDELAGSVDLNNLDWDSAHLGVLGGDVGAISASASRIRARIEQMLPRYVEYDELLVGTRLGVELRAAAQDWTTRFRAKINQGHFAGGPIRGSRAVSVLMGNDPLLHLEHMVEELRDVGSFWARLLSARGSSSTELLLQIRDFEGTRFLFLRELMQATSCADIGLGRAWRGRTVWYMADSILANIGWANLSALTEQAHEVARYEHHGGDPRRIEAIVDAASDASRIEQEGAGEPELRRVTSRLRDGGERQLFLDQLMVLNRYSHVLTAAGEDLRSELLAGTTHGFDASDEVLSAGEMFMQEAALVALEGALGIAGVSQAELEEFIGDGRGTLIYIVDNAGDFFGLIVDGFKGGFRLFKDNFGSHLEEAFGEWMSSQLGEADLDLPSEWNAGGIFDLARQVLGLDNDGLAELARTELGDTAGDLVEQVLGYLDTFIAGGWDALWEEIQGDLGSLYETVLDGVKSWLIENVVREAIEYVLSLATPIGGLARIIQSVWTVYEFVQENIARIQGFIAQVLEVVKTAIAAIQGATAEGLAGAIEGLLHRGLVLAINFLADFLGLGDIGERIQEILEDVRETVHGAIAGFLRRLMGQAEDGELGDSIEGDPVQGGVAQAGDLHLTVEGGSYDVSYLMTWQSQVDDRAQFAQAWYADGVWKDEELAALVAANAEGSASEWLRSQGAGYLETIEGVTSLSAAGRDRLTEHVHGESLSLLAPGAQITVMAFNDLQVSGGPTTEATTGEPAEDAPVVAPEGEEQLELPQPVRFEAGGENHRLWAEQTPDGVELMVASTPMTVSARLAAMRRQAVGLPAPEQQAMRDDAAAAERQSDEALTADQPAPMRAALRRLSGTLGRLFGLLPSDDDMNAEETRQLTTPQVAQQVLGSAFANFREFSAVPTEIMSAADLRRRAQARDRDAGREPGDYDGVEGLCFYDEPMIWLVDSPSLMTAGVHELLHAHTAGDWRANVGNAFNEGTTERMAEVALHTFGIVPTRSAYPNERRVVHQFLEKTGQSRDALYGAYLSGGAQSVVVAHNDSRSVGPWSLIKTALRDANWDRAIELMDQGGLPAPVAGQTSAREVLRDEGGDTIVEFDLDWQVAANDRSRFVELYYCGGWDLSALPGRLEYWLSSALRTPVATLEAIPGDERSGPQTAEAVSRDIMAWFDTHGGAVKLESLSVSLGFTPLDAMRDEAAQAPPGSGAAGQEGQPGLNAATRASDRDGEDETAASEEA